MPCGYLKNQATRVGVKKARGGSSRNARTGGQKKRGARGCKHRRFSKAIGLEDICEHFVDGRYHNDDIFYLSESSHCEDIEERYYHDDSASDLQIISQSPCHITLGACGMGYAAVTDFVSKGSEEHDTVKVDSMDNESFVSILHSLPASFGRDDSYSLCSGVSRSPTDSFTFVAQMDGDDGECILSIDTTEMKERKDTVVIRAPAESDVGSSMNDSIKNDRAFPSVKCREDDNFKCTICLEDLSLDEELRLFRKCEHPMACRECLHTYYIKNGLNSTSPLRCYWPSCGRRLGDVQARLLTTNEHELETFYTHQSQNRRVQKGKACSRREAGEKENKRPRRKIKKEIAKMKNRQRVEAAKLKKRQLEEAEKRKTLYAALQERRIRNFKALQYCQACDTATPVYPSRGATFQCRGCKSQSIIDVMTYEDVKALVHADVGPLAPTDSGKTVPAIRSLGDLLVNCPSCCTLIIKDGGCNRMECAVCYSEFSFTAAKVLLDK